MNEFKESYYNIKRNFKDTLIVFNSLNGNFVQFDGNIAKKADDLLKGIQTAEDTCLHEFLLKQGFIIKEDSCEKTALDKLRESVINDSQQLNLIILPTEKCNFRCAYCYEDFERGAMSTEVQEKIIDFVRKNIKKYKKINVDWFGGEPLLNINILEKLSMELIELCNQNRVLYTAEVTTNGYFLTPENMIILKKCKIYKFQVTLDGLEETHDKQRKLYNGDKTWKVIVNNLRFIRDNISSGLIQIVIRTNFTRDMYNDYKKYLMFLKKEFGNDKRFKYLFRLASDWGNIQENSIKAKFCDEDQYMEILNYSLQNEFFNVGMKACLNPGGLLCYAWKNNTVLVRSDGIIGKCTLNLDAKENQIAQIDNYDLDVHPSFWDVSTVGIPDKCEMCKKYPICLKVNCNMSTKGEADCEFEMKKFEEFMPYLCKSEYGCKYISREDVMKIGSDKEKVG